MAGNGGQEETAPKVFFFTDDNRGFGRLVEYQEDIKLDEPD